MVTQFQEHLDKLFPLRWFDRLYYELLVLAVEEEASALAPGVCGFASACEQVALEDLFSVIDGVKRLDDLVLLDATDLAYLHKGHWFERGYSAFDLELDDVLEGARFVYYGL